MGIDATTPVRHTTDRTPSDSHRSHAPVTVLEPHANARSKSVFFQRSARRRRPR
jgi:hypothetical protein